MTEQSQAEQGYCRCPSCGEVKRLRTDGRVWTHRIGAKLCRGSGERPGWRDPEDKRS